MKITAHIFINGWSAARDIEIEMPDDVTISDDFATEVTTVIDLPNGARVFATGKGKPQ